MKTTPTLLLLFLSYFDFAQTLSFDSGTTRAVIIGISDYQDENIPDLRFSDKDAQAFKDYLQSPSGGALTAEQILMLTNEKATTGQLVAALEWLIETSEENDKAIIYFSGHGDVESLTRFQRGFLLTYDSPPKSYMAGAFGLVYLQDIISTLSDKNVEVVMISDACRAGKLAGSAIGGTQATASNLAKQFANEVKIMSCQPNEFSLEGEQWGGGRGAFSFHLIDGLNGFADRNNDLQVNLFELGRYIEDKVSQETAPHPQLPFTVGDRNTQLSTVDQANLEKLKEAKSKELPTFAGIETKGIEERILADADSTVQELYRQFLVALEDRKLLEPLDSSADFYYRKLMEEESIQSLHGYMRRNFAASLQDGAQQAINAYLLANPAELKRRYERDDNYDRYPKYLKRALEILGEKHFYYKNLQAKLRYFEGLLIRLEGDQNWRKRDSLYQVAVEKQTEALGLVERAPFILNELGVLHTRLKLDEKAFDYYEKAIELTPEWGLPYVNYCVSLFYNGQYEKAIEYGEKGLEYLPQYPQLYNFLAWVYANDEDWLDKQNWKRLGLELSNNIEFPELNINSLAQNRKRYKRGIELLEKAKEADSNYVHTWLNLGGIYWQTKNYDKAEQHLKRTIQLDSTNWKASFWLGRLYVHTNRVDKAEVAFLKSLAVAKYDWAKGTIYNSLASVYSIRNDDKKYEATMEKAIELAPNFKYTYTNFANYYIDRNEFEKAEDLLIQVLQKDINHLPTYNGTGRLYRKMNRHKDGIYLLEKVLEMKPNYVDAIEQLANFYAVIDSMELAIKTINKLVGLSPNKAPVYYELGKLYYGELKDYEEAIIHFNKAIETRTEPYNWDYIRLSDIYIEQEKYEEALNAIKKALEIRPDYDRAYNRLGYIYQLQKNYKKAKRAYRKSIQLDVSYTRPYENLFNLFFELEQSDSVELMIKAILNKNPKNAVGYSELGRHYLKTQQVEKAIESLKTAIELDSVNIIYPYNLACGFALKGDTSNALEWLEKSIQIGYQNYDHIQTDPDLESIRGTESFNQIMEKYFPNKVKNAAILDGNKAIYFPKHCGELGNIYYRTFDNNEHAERLLLKALELEPKNENHISNLVAFYLGTHQYEKALEMSQKALDSKDMILRARIGVTFLYNNDFENAQKHIEFCTQQDSLYYNFWAVPGTFWFLNAKPKIAETYLNKAIQINSEYTYAHEQLASMKYAYKDEKAAFEILDKLIQNNTNEPKVHLQKAFLHLQSGQDSLAKESLNLTKERWSEYNLVLDFLEHEPKENYDAATESYEEFISRFEYWNGRSYFDYLYCEMLMKQEKHEEALTVLDDILSRSIMIGIGAFNYEMLQNDEDLNPIKKTEKFREMMRKYFPNQSENKSK